MLLISYVLISITFILFIGIPCIIKYYCNKCYIILPDDKNNIYNIENQMNTQQQIINPLLPYNNSNHSNNNNNNNNSNHNNHNNYCNYNNHRKISNRDELSSLLA